MENNIFNKLFTLEDIEEIKNTKNSKSLHIIQPILYLFDKNNRNENYNTNFSLNSIFLSDNQYYLNNKKKEIMEESDFTNINGKLGEIRCYGYLLSSFMNTNINTTPIKVSNNQTADFQISNPQTNETIYIEVNTKQCNDKESEKYKIYKDNLNQNINQHTTIVKNRKISIDLFSFAPFGRTKDHTNIDVIQKISQIKQSKYQIPENEYGILWLDFQSQDIAGLISLEHAEPLWYNRNFGMFSGVLWYALYGKKYLPIFISSQFDLNYKGYEKFYKMKHDGLFMQRKDISAVIIAEETYSLYFENPFCEKRIPLWFLEKIINIPHFKYEHSRILFPKYDIKQEVNNNYKKIEKLSQYPNRTFD